MQTAKRNGCAIVNGVEILVQLAMGIFTEWTGVKDDELVFQSAVAAALGEPEPGTSRRTTRYRSDRRSSDSFMTA